MSNLHCPTCGATYEHDSATVHWTDVIYCKYCGSEDEKWMWKGDPTSTKTFEWDSDLRTTLHNVDRDELCLLEQWMHRHFGREYTVETHTWTDGSWQATLSHVHRPDERSPWRYNLIRFSNGRITELAEESSSDTSLRNPTQVAHNTLYEP